jgi:hypothetical protein
VSIPPFALRWLVYGPALAPETGLAARFRRDTRRAWSAGRAGH